MRRQYTEAVEGEWHAVDPTDHRVACCDCGLAHRFELRKRKGQFEMRAFRDERATAQLRRYRHYPARIREVQ